MPLWPNKHGVQEYFAYYRNSSEPTGLEPTVLVIGRGDFIEKLETTRF
jgi:hypothetical protein